MMGRVKGATGLEKIGIAIWLAAFAPTCPSLASTGFVSKDEALLIRIRCGAVMALAEGALAPLGAKKSSATATARLRHA
jgi:hypothetical protein